MDALAGVLAGVESDELAELLGRGNGSPEQAVAIYFSAGYKRLGWGGAGKGAGGGGAASSHSTSAANTKGMAPSGGNKATGGAKPQPEKKTSASVHSLFGRPAPAGVGNDWEFRQLGDTVVKAFTTDDVDVELLPVGAKVELSHSAPDSSKSAKGKACGKQQAGKAGKGTPATVKKIAEGIVRWGIPEGRTGRGRLPGDMSSCLFTLLGAGVCRATCTVVAPLDSNKRFANLCLSVSVSTSDRVFDDASLHGALIRLVSVLKMSPTVAAQAPDEVHDGEGNSKRPLMICDSSAGEEPAQKKHRHAPQPLDTPVAPDDAYEAASEDGGLKAEDIAAVVDACTAHSGLAAAQQPVQMASELRHYQLQGLAFMLAREQEVPPGDRDLHPLWSQYAFADGQPFYVKPLSKVASLKRPEQPCQPRGGILADEMGLGKTVQVLALVASGKPCCGGKRDALVDLTNDEESSPPAHLCENDGETRPPAAGEGRAKREAGSDGGAKGSMQAFLGMDAPLKRKLLKGGTLVVCPMSLLGQWEDQAHTHVKPGVLRVHVHYGGDRTASAAALGSAYDVVLTTYGVLSSEHQAFEGGGSGGALFRVQWSRVVLDEAHVIKGRASSVAAAATALTATCRWALSGTPLQNSIDDLYPLLRFLRAEPWDDRAYFASRILRPFVEQGDRGVLARVQQILGPILLKRTKASKSADGNPIISLPQRLDMLVELSLSEPERNVYDTLMKQSRRKFETLVAAGKVMHNYASILEMLLRLRQTCNHPSLALAPAPETSTLLGEQGGEVLRASDCGDAECSICLDAVEDPVKTACNHVFCRECLTVVLRRSANGPDGSLCPMCRSPVSTKELFTQCPRPLPKGCSSTKIEALVRVLRDIRADGGGKTVVFSQWTGMLDLVEAAFATGGVDGKAVPYIRLDGSLAQKQRASNVALFAARPEIEVMLISTRAGGVGINLTAASNVILLDLWWNPAVDDQAIARIHRLGQNKEVTVRKFVIKDSIEEKILKLQDRKRDMVEGALGMSKEASHALCVEDLRNLFGV